MCGGRNIVITSVCFGIQFVVHRGQETELLWTVEYRFGGLISFGFWQVF